MQASICKCSVQFENVHHFEISNLHASLQIVARSIVHFENPHAMCMQSGLYNMIAYQPVYIKQEV